MTIEALRWCMIRRMAFFALLSAALLAAAAGAVHSFTGSLASRADGLEMIEYVKLYDGMNPLKFKDLATIKDMTGSDRVSAYRETPSYVTNRSRYGIWRGIKAVQTDENYKIFYRTQMIKGAFPDAKSISQGDRLAVISDDLAMKLFKSMNVIGMEFKLQDMDFKVSGIYKARNSLLWKLCGDGCDRVFVPYTSMNGGTRDTLGVLAVACDPDQYILTNTAKIESGADINLSAYEPVEFKVLATVLRQYIRLYLAILGILAIICILIYMYRRTQKLIRQFKDSAESFYMRDVIRTERKRLIAYASVFLACCLVVVFIIYMIRFKYYISERYIPYDNIFDLKFYMDTIMSDTVNGGSYPGRIFSIVEYTYKKFLIFDLICLSASALLFIPAFMFARLAVRMKRTL